MIEGKQLDYIHTLVEQIVEGRLENMVEQRLEGRGVLTRNMGALLDEAGDHLGPLVTKAVLTIDDRLTVTIEKKVDNR